MNVNRILLAGNVTRDLQLSYLPSQTAVVEFGLAMNRKWKDKTSGEQREETCFVDCRCYGQQAETLNKYVSKGDPLFIEGRLQLDTWKAKDDSNRSKLRVLVESFQFLGKVGGGAEGAATVQTAPAESTPTRLPPNDSRIPF